MSNVSIYKFDNTTEIRVVEIEGNPWFLAVDVLAALGMDTRQSQNYLRHLDSSEKQVICITQGKGNPNKTVITESGLYKLVLRSDKPEARRFQDWVTRDVLPAIRKDGAYIMGEEKVATGEMDEDAFVLKAIEILQRKIDRLKAENDAMSQELNVLTVDEYRALTHRYFTHSQKVKLGQAAARILRAQGQEPQRQERTVRFHGEERIVRVNLYPRAALEQAERELAA
ncbi:Bro-N domain-containing protein [Pseudomonas aeruginosa]|uniref:BRO-N domain-containing protein n=1 Tax=Pseudomonas aeruginosa TaxID=287 RepID=UPI0038968C11